jgi:hypothetical protein
MIAEAGAAISSIKVAMDIAKGIAALKSKAEINQAIIDIQRILLEAQSGAIEDKQRIATLAAEVQELQLVLKQQKNWEEEAKRYVLTESEVGTFTYELRREFADTEVHHRLCVTCFENGKKSVLQCEAFAVCNNCGTRIKMRKMRPASELRI